MDYKISNLMGLRIACAITRSDTIGDAHIHVTDLAVALRERGSTVPVFGGKVKVD
jgi:hypothetical protein